MKILVVEDNQKLAKYIATMLTEVSYIVDTVADGLAGERRILSGEYDLVILDIMLPEKDGLAVCKTVRQEGSVVPILMLTARGEVADKIIGLDSGADDYLVKPFVMEELLARVRSLLRRPQTTLEEVITVQDISLNLASHTVTKAGQVVSLTLKEYAVLGYLMRHAGSVVTREQLISHCWDFAYSAFSNITDVYVKQLRQKFDSRNEQYIKTIRGVGYLFKTE
jgi:DNA-binding response OmpR family regulator